MLQISATISGMQSHCCHYDVSMLDNLPIWDFSLNIWSVQQLLSLHLKHEWRFLLNNEMADRHVNWETIEWVNENKVEDKWASVFFIFYFGPCWCFPEGRDKHGGLCIYLVTPPLWRTTWTDPETSTLCYIILPIFIFSCASKNGLICGSYWIKQRIMSVICIYPPHHTETDLCKGGVKPSCTTFPH